MKKTLLTFLLAIALYSIVQGQTAPYQDIQANASFQPIVQEGNKDFSLWYIIGAFATAISFLATMYIRTHSQLIAEKDRSIVREIERAKEDKQIEIQWDAQVKDLLNKQQIMIESIAKHVEGNKETLTQIRIDLQNIVRNQP